MVEAMTRQIVYLGKLSENASASRVSSHSSSIASNKTASPETTSTSTTSSQGTLTPDSQHSQHLKMADATNVITQGCLRQITENTLTAEQPIVQCVQIKPMASQGTVERYRVVMNDSVNFMQGMLSQREFSTAVIRDTPADSLG